MRLLLLPIILLAIAVIQGCAHSAVTREVSGNADLGYQNAHALVEGAADSNIADSYQNTSQATKGVLLGGITGAAVGATTSGVGLVAGLAGGAILGGAFGAYIDGYTTLRDQLENRGLQMVSLGDQILIVVPSDRLFSGFTPNIRVSAYSTLDIITKVINSYPNMMVKIAVYTNCSAPRRVTVALSQEQAESVEKYLWRTGVNTRMLYAAGYGGTNLVEKNSLDAKSINNRVEITLEKLPV